MQEQITAVRTGINAWQKGMAAVRQQLNMDLRRTKAPKRQKILQTAPPQVQRQQPAPRGRKRPEEREEAQQKRQRRQAPESPEEMEQEDPEAQQIFMDTDVEMERELIQWIPVSQMANLLPAQVRRPLEEPTRITWPEAVILGVSETIRRDQIMSEMGQEWAALRETKQRVEVEVNNAPARREVVRQETLRRGQIQYNLMQKEYHLVRQVRRKAREQTALYKIEHASMRDRARQELEELSNRTEIERWQTENLELATNKQVHKRHKQLLHRLVLGEVEEAQRKTVRVTEGDQRRKIIEERLQRKQALEAWRRRRGTKRRADTQTPAKRAKLRGEEAEYNHIVLTGESRVGQWESRAVEERKGVG